MTPSYADRNVRKAVAGILVGLLLGSCSRLPSQAGVPDLAGTYVLESIDGHSLPARVADSTQFAPFVVVAETLFITNDIPRSRGVTLDRSTVLDSKWIQLAGDPAIRQFEAQLDLARVGGELRLEDPPCHITNGICVLPTIYQVLTREGGLDLIYLQPRWLPLKFRRVH